MSFLWILDADAIWVLAPAIGTLWAVGGSGLKWIRRFLAPLLIGVSAISVGIGIIPSALTTVLLSLAASLAYGSGKKNELGGLYWPFLFGIGALNGLSLIPLAFSSGYWLTFIGCVFLCSITFGALTFASQKFDFPKWKFVEILTGSSVGASVSFLLI